jgi:hypothetical protein
MISRAVCTVRSEPTHCPSRPGALIILDQGKTKHISLHKDVRFLACSGELYPAHAFSRNRDNTQRLDYGYHSRIQKHKEVF